MSPLKRRQFGQLAAASLTSTILADLSSKALAQKSEPSQEILYGVNLPSESNAQNRNREDQNVPVNLSTADRATGKVVSEINVPSQAVDNLSSLPKNLGLSLLVTLTGLRKRQRLEMGIW